MSIERARIIQRKSPAEIANQVIGNNRYVLDLTGQSLIPPSIKDTQDLGNLTEIEAKTRFGTERYGILVEVMKADIAGHDPDEDRQYEIGRHLEVLNGVDRYVANHYASPENQVLYPKQMEIFESLARFLENGGREGYFKLPTAVGKTVIFTEFAKAAGLRTLIVVPTLELLDQTEDTFARLATDLSLGKVFEGNRDFQQQFTVATYRSFLNLLNPRREDPEQADFLPDDFDLVILDEAHHALGPQTTQALSLFPDAIKLGFTATPFYSEVRHLGKLLDTQIYGMSIKEAAKEGLISPFKVWLALTDTDISGVEIYSSTGDYNQTQLAKAVNVFSRNKAAADLYEQGFGEESAVVYCVTIKHAQEVAKLFRDRGIKAEAVWGNMGRKKRSAVIEGFKKGEIKVLCNMQLLTEGFNAPNASVCINLRPTLSAVLAEQRGGRVLRNDPANPEKEATIIDFVDRGRSFNQLITFAEVAETAGLPEKLKVWGGIDSSIGEVRAKLSENGTSEQPQFTIENLKVLTDVLQVMSVATQSMELRNKVNNGYIVCPTGELAEEFGIDVVTVGNHIRKLSEEYPEHAIRRGTGYPFLLNEEGLKLLREDLSYHKLPEGYLPVETAELASKFDLPKYVVHSNIRRLRRSHPEEVVRRGGNKVVIATQVGVELLRQGLANYQIGEDYIPVNIQAIAREHGIISSTLMRHLTSLSEKYPMAILPRGVRRNMVVNGEGMKLLKEELDRLSLT